MKIDKLTMNGESIDFKIGIVKESPGHEAFKFLDIKLTGEQISKKVVYWCKSQQLISVKCFVGDFCFSGYFLITSYSTIPSNKYELTLKSSGLISHDQTTGYSDK